MPKNTKKQQPIKDLPVEKTEEIKGGATGIGRLAAVSNIKAQDTSDR